MNDFETKIIELIRKSKNPEKTLRLVTEIITYYISSVHSNDRLDKPEDIVAFVLRNGTK